MFRNSYFRLVEAAVDLWWSVIYYFRCIFGSAPDSLPPVTEYSNVLFIWFWVPESWAEFRQLVNDYFLLLFNEYNFRYFMQTVLHYLSRIARILTLTIPLIMALYLAVKESYLEVNNNWDQDTPQLQRWKKWMQHTFVPVKAFVLDLVNYVKGIPGLWKLWTLTWLCSFNLSSIALAFFGFYFYFAVSFDLANLFLQLFKLIIDGQFLFRYLPGVVWICLGYFIFDRIRRSIGKNNLAHMESKNCGFIKSLPVVTMACGSMGKKKTTLITDMALSQEKMFRQKVFQIMRSCDMKFPKFPWILFENDMKVLIRQRHIYNLATIRSWVQQKKELWDQSKEPELLYRYDWEKHGLLYCDELGGVGLFEILETYAQAYFIYTIESSLIISNFSIRSTESVEDYDNLPLRFTDFFNSGAETENRYSHILDFDALRLGKKIDPKNPSIGSFEFGVVTISEIGKERGNKNDERGMKKLADEANQLNDLFNSWLKLCRHSATVDFFPFVRVFVDDQRPESWGADARELADLLNIVESGEAELAMPFYTIEDMLIEWILNVFNNIYTVIRNRRGDNTLLIHLMKKAAAFLYQRDQRIKNLFGYCILFIEKERGTKDGEVELKEYYLMDQKIYNHRFSTDCFSEFFNKQGREAVMGIDDVPSYSTGKASVSELQQQNSYFVRSLYGEAQEDE